MLAGTLAVATAITGYYLAVQTALRYANGAGLGMPPPPDRPFRPHAAC
jgi:hypothetical protein